MNSLAKSIAFWVIWAIVVGSTIWFIVASSHAVSQGAGAKALLRGIKQTGPPPLPAIVKPPTIRTNFYAVTATDNTGLSSDYSSEVFAPNSWVMLAWDASICTNVITNYTVYRGTNSRAYTKTFQAGTNCTLRVPPPQPTNIVITVTGQGTNWTATNPAGMRWFKGTNMVITKRYQ